MVPIRLSEEAVDDLFRRAVRPGYKITVDLQSCKITDDDGLELTFDVDAHRRHCLIHGLDDIGQTLEHADKIDAYEKAHGMQPLGASS
jgi:3-isopropylmalate/(R)-2-methylmalate dehydratase small subunit